MADLRTEVAGVRLRNPTLLASGFLDETGGSMLRVFNAGAGGVVTKSIGPEPREGNLNPTVVELDVGLLNAVGLPNPGIADYEAEVKHATSGGAVVIGSVYGRDAAEYAAVATRMASYGVLAVELNLSCPHAKGLGTEIAQDPEAVEEITHAVKKVVKVPVLSKLSPNVADIASFAEAAKRGGADAVTAINTVKSMAISADLKIPILKNTYGGLSGPAIKPVGLRCVYEIFESVRIPIVGVGGIATGADAIEYMMAGAAAVQIGTAILERGIDVFTKVPAEIAAWMDANGYAKVSELVGAAHGK
ncbi:MAG TPA: dihydroorotate dehydrogenase [Thermoplasmata archaeon]|nr:dihydroorotate dehydrogenase [Thermoplasmata archaeon]